MDKMNEKMTLIFFQNINDPSERKVPFVWVANKEYPVEFQQENSYWTKDETGQLRGISKKFEGQLFVRTIYKKEI